VLTVVIALTLDMPLNLAQALHFGGAFIAGGLWAVLLTLVLLGSARNRPAMRAVAEVWDLLVGLTRDLMALTQAEASGQPGSADEWLAHARVHRRAVRESLEGARIAIAASFRVRGPRSVQAMTNLMRLEIAERIFGALIVLSDLVEHDRDGTTRQHALRLLRRVLRLLPKVGGQEPSAAPQRVSRAIVRINRMAGAPPAFAAVAATIAEWSLAALRLQQDANAAIAGATANRLRFERVSFWEPLRDNLTWDSAILRHAVRVTVVAVPAIAVALIFWNPYSHWLSYSVALTMQPFFSAAWQRVLERVGGTVVGAMIGGAMAFLPQTPLVHAELLLPLCILGFSTRQVSYGAFIACLTPLIVLLFDIVEPGHSAWTIALMRVAYTIAGGALTMAASFLLWPSWEPQRLRSEFGSTLAAYAEFSRRMAAHVAGASGKQELEEARRAAGVATNNYEASLSRALQEPRRGRGHLLRTALLADGAFRQLGALLMTLEYTAGSGDEAERIAWPPWAAWVGGTLERLGSDLPALPSPAPPGSTAFAHDVDLRIQAQLSLLREARLALEQAG
jgi:uncharacterized membrane protein YccC